MFSDGSVKAIWRFTTKGVELDLLEDIGPEVIDATASEASDEYRRPHR